MDGADEWFGWLNGLCRRGHVDRALRELGQLFVGGTFFIERLLKQLRAKFVAEQFGALIRDDSAKWAKLIKEAGIKAD